MAPTKPFHRRKSKTPKRVVRSDNNEEIPEGQKDENLMVIPQDPMALAKFINERSITDFFARPIVPDLFYEMITKHRAAAAAGEEPVYACTCCNEKSYSSVAGLQYHIMHTCPSLPEPKFTCLICQENFDVQMNVLDHIQSAHVDPYIDSAIAETVGRRAAHAGRLKIQMFAESSVAAQSLGAQADDSSATDYVEEIPEQEVLEYQVDEECVSSKQKTKRIKLTGSVGDTYSGVDKPLAEAFQWTLATRRKLETAFHHICPNLLPCLTHWELMRDVDLTGRFQLFKESPLFAMDFEMLNKIRTNKKMKIKAGDKKNLTFERLKLFQSLPVKSGASLTFYVGGPVWSMSWCPNSLHDMASDQFLALCTHVGEHALEPDITYNDEVLIQLWNCGQLPLKLTMGTNNLQTPTLAYCIAISAGPVWCLEWCPLVENVLNLSSDGERLGLLAAACGSGDIYIYAMPKPESNNFCNGDKKSNGTQSSSPGSGNIYKVSPTLVLRPSRKGCFGQCLCLSWSTNDGCNFLAAGFSSGFVAMWKITSKSRLLLFQENGCQTLHAFHVYRAHSKAVRDVVWCPFDSNILVSTGSDKFLKIWDRRRPDTEIPHNIPPKMSITHEIVWSPLWCGLYAASASVFSIPHFHGCCYLNLGSSSATPLLSVVPFKAASWTVSTNDWLNGVATGDVCGNAIVSASNNWNRSYIANKKYSRILLFTTEAVWDDKKKPEKPFYLTSETYDHHCNDAYKLVFYETDNEDTSQWREKEAYMRVRKLEDFDDESFSDPVAAIHKMRWNPNIGSFSWVATGTCSGLVRLHCLTGMISRDVENRWNKFTRTNTNQFA